MIRKVRGALIALLSGLVPAAVPASAQTAKKVVRMHTAGANDVNLETRMLAFQFANYVSANSDAVEVKVFPRRIIDKQNRTC